MDEILAQSNRIMLEPTTPEFRPYGKTPRWSGNQQVIITEKIDGTNALVHIDEHGRLFAGSRNRWLAPGKKSDNYGFAQWCEENREELLKLGPGWHYGEWWGRGIGRGYGLETRHFSLFNTHRWSPHNPNTPACVSAVPLLYNGGFTGREIEEAVDQLQYSGSVAAPGFRDIEGVVAYFPGSDQKFKVVVDKKGPSPIE